MVAQQASRQRVTVRLSFLILRPERFRDQVGHSFRDDLVHRSGTTGKVDAFASEQVANIIPESVAKFDRNRWPTCPGMRSLSARELKRSSNRATVLSDESLTASVATRTSERCRMQKGCHIRLGVWQLFWVCGIPRPEEWRRIIEYICLGVVPADHF